MDPTEDTEIKEWTEAAGIGVDYLDFLSQHASLAEWIAFSRVFAPEFVEVEGCILWDRSYDPENFRLWHDKLSGKTAAIESTLNQLRLWLYIDIEDDETSRANSLLLAQEIATSWHSALKRAFPLRSFDVQAIDTIDGPIVSFASTTKRP